MKKYIKASIQQVELDSEGLYQPINSNLAEEYNTVDDFEEAVFEELAMKDYTVASYTNNQGRDTYIFNLPFGGTREVDESELSLHIDVDYNEGNAVDNCAAGVITSFLN